MKTILIPTDFSPSAINAMNYALDLAAKEEAKTILLHVFSERKLKKFKESDIKSAEEELMSLHTQIVESKKIGCERLLLQGEAEKEILRVIEERKPGLAVIGMRGAGKGLQRIIGRTARSIIEKANCPVMAIPENAGFKEIKKITYATDYHESDIDALKTLTDMANPFSAIIELLHISDKNKTSDTGLSELENFKERVKEKTGYENLLLKLLPGKNIPNELEEYSKKNSTDLLVMSTHHRGIIDKLFGKSITRQISFHSTIPLLVFHHKQKPVIFIFGLAIMK